MNDHDLRQPSPLKEVETYTTSDTPRADALFEKSRAAEIQDRLALKERCEQQEAEIARLTRELEEARADLKLAAGTAVEDALLVPRAALSQLRADRDEARQALEAERARVAELEGALNQIRLTLSKPAPDPGCHSWERFGQHALTAFRESEVIAYRALAAEGGEG